VNLLLCVVAAATFVALRAFTHTPDDAFAYRLWGTVLVMNAILFLLNMIPLPPLDGFGALEGAFDLGSLGPALRSLQPFPLILAFVLANLDAFHDLVQALCLGLVTVFSMPFRP